MRSNVEGVSRVDDVGVKKGDIGDVRVVSTVDMMMGEISRGSGRFALSRKVVSALLFIIMSQVGLIDSLIDW